VAAHLLGLRVRMGHGYLSVVSCTGRGLCDGPIPHAGVSTDCAYASVTLICWVGRKRSDLLDII
jgi:hypothetical protein